MFLCLIADNYVENVDHYPCYFTVMLESEGLHEQIQILFIQVLCKKYLWE